MSLPPLPSHLDPRGRHRRRQVDGGRRGLLRPARRVLGALISSALLLASGYYWVTFRNIERSVAKVQGLHTGAATPSAGASSSAAPQAPTKAMNILIVGNDDRTNMTRKEQLDLHVGRGDGSNSTDTMMLVHIPADGSRATLISIPRDSWVNIPGFGWGKLNGAYVDAYNATNGSHLAKEKAGANKLIDAVKDLTGQPVDHYLQIGLLGFYRIANALDGIPVTLCNSVDDSQYSGFVASKGPHVLNGKEALEFVRQRHGLTSDLDRVKRQQYFLTSAFRQVASVGLLTKLTDLGSAVTSSIFTDIDLLDLARQVSKLTANNIRGVTIPTTPGTTDGLDVLFVNKTQVSAYVASVLGEKTSTSTSPSTPSSSAPTSATPTKPRKAIDASCVN